MIAINAEVLDRDPIGASDFIYALTRKGRDIYVVSCELFDGDGTGFVTFEDQMKAHTPLAQNRLSLLGFGPCAIAKVFVGPTMADAYFMRDLWVKRENIHFVSDAEAISAERVAEGKRKIEMKDDKWVKA